MQSWYGSILCLNLTGWDTGKQEAPISQVPRLRWLWIGDFKFYTGNPNHTATASQRWGSDLLICDQYRLDNNALLRMCSLWAYSCYLQQTEDTHWHQPQSRRSSPIWSTLFGQWWCHNASTNLITGQYCGRLLKFSAHSLNVLGIRYKVFKYVFLLIISYIHIYETIFQICFFYWWYHIYIYTRPYWDAISWDNSYMMIIWSTWPLKIPNT